MIEYNIIAQRYGTQQDVTIDKRCNAWAARNLGDTPVTVNGILLNPSLIPGQIGESVSVGGNLGELFAGRITIIFYAAGGMVFPQVEITQKFYLPEKI